MAVITTAAIGHSATPPKNYNTFLFGTYVVRLKRKENRYPFRLPLSTEVPRATWQPKLRKKTVGKATYLWFTKAGGDTSLRQRGRRPAEAARKAFREHLGTLAGDDKARKHGALLAGALMDHFLAWIEKNRSRQTYKTRRTACRRFAEFRVGSASKTRIADLPADKVRGEDLEAWLDHLDKDRKLTAQTRRHAETSIKHCWTWGTKHPSVTPYLSADLPPVRSRGAAPFVGAQGAHRSRPDNWTRKAGRTLFKAAKVDLDEFHRFGPKKRRKVNPYQVFADMLKCYHAHRGQDGRAGRLRGRAGDVLFKDGARVILGEALKRSTPSGRRPSATSPSTMKPATSSAGTATARPRTRRCS